MAIPTFLSLSFPFLFLFFFCNFVTETLSFSGEQAAPKTFIFRVDSHAKPSIFPTHYHWYTTEFADAPQILHVYDTVFHGFSAVLSTDQVAYASHHPSVLAVFEDKRRQLHTTRSPQFLGLRNQRGLWSESDYGSDVIIGVFDTGIWPERRSFSDLNLGPIPSRWKGACESGAKFSVRNCNRKLIGARFFSKGYLESFWEGGGEEERERDLRKVGERKHIWTGHRREREKERKRERGGRLQERERDECGKKHKKGKIGYKKVMAY